MLEILKWRDKYLISRYGSFGAHFDTVDNIQNAELFENLDKRYLGKEERAKVISDAENNCFPGAHFVQVEIQEVEA